MGPGSPAAKLGPRGAPGPPGALAKTGPGAPGIDLKSNIKNLIFGKKLDFSMFVDFRQLGWFWVGFETKIGFRMQFRWLDMGLN